MDVWGRCEQQGKTEGAARAAPTGRRSELEGAGRYSSFAQPPKSLFSQPKKPPPPRVLEAGAGAGVGAGRTGGSGAAAAGPLAAAGAACSRGGGGACFGAGTLAARCICSWWRRRMESSGTPARICS